MKRVILIIAAFMMLCSAAYAGNYCYGNRVRFNNYGYNNFVQKQVQIIERVPIVNLEVFAPHNRVNFKEHARVERVIIREQVPYTDRYGRVFFNDKEVVIQERVILNGQTQNRFQTRIVERNGYLVRETLDLVLGRIIQRQNIIQRNRFRSY